MKIERCGDTLILTAENDSEKPIIRSLIEEGFVADCNLDEECAGGCEVTLHRYIGDSGPYQKDFVKNVRAFEKMRPELLKTYEQGTFVAISGGKVIDSAPDQDTLLKRHHERGELCLIQEVICADEESIFRS